MCFTAAKKNTNKQGGSKAVRQGDRKARRQEVKEV